MQPHVEHLSPHARLDLPGALPIDVAAEQLAQPIIIEDGHSGLGGLRVDPPAAGRLGLALVREIVLA